MRIQRCWYDVCHTIKAIKEHTPRFRSNLLLLIYFFYINHVPCSMESNFWRMTFWSTFNKSNELLLQIESPFFWWKNSISNDSSILCSISEHKKKRLVPLPIKEMHQTKIMKLIKFAVRIENISKEIALNY